MSTFHYDMIDQIEGAVKMPAMETFPTMIVAVSSGAIDGYVADRPGAVSATSANADLTYITFDEGQGFTVSPDDAQIAVGVKQGSPLKAQINEILAGISAEERNAHHGRGCARSAAERVIKRQTRLSGSRQPFYAPWGENVGALPQALPRT